MADDGLSWKRQARTTLAEALPAFLLDLARRGGFQVGCDGRVDREESALHMRFEKNRTRGSIHVSVQVHWDGLLTARYTYVPPGNSTDIYREEGSYTGEKKYTPLERVIVWLTEDHKHVQFTKPKALPLETAKENLRMTTIEDQATEAAPFVLKEGFLDTRGIDRAVLLAALYNAAQPLGRGFLQARPGGMTVEQARELLPKPEQDRAQDDNARMFPSIRTTPRGSIYFDYLYGRPLKILLTDPDQFNPGLYDRDQGGDGAAARIVAQIRNAMAKEEADK